MKCHRQDGGFLCQGLPAIGYAMDYAMGYAIGYAMSYSMSYAIDYATCSIRD